MTGIRRGAAAAAALLAVVRAGHAATPADAHRGRVMDIDAVVTDSAGRPVTGLARDAFQVRIDREDVDVDYFAAVRDGRVSRADLESLSPDLVLSPGDREDPAAVSRHFLFWIDEGALTPARRRRAVTALHDLLGRLGPADEAAVIAERSRPEALAGWTARRDTLEAAVDAVVARPESAARRGAGERPISAADRESRPRGGEPGASAEPRTKLGDLAESLALFADRAGKKIVIVLAEGLGPPGGSVSPEPPAGSSATPRRDPGEDLRRVVDRANALETTVFTIDARVLDGPNEGPAGPPRPHDDAETPLARLAEETGGEAVVRGTDLASGLATILRDVSTYYSLGVDLRNVPADAAGRIDVALDRPGLRVRARRTWSSEDEESRIEDRVRCTLLTATSYADLAPVVRVGPPARDGAQTTVPVNVDVSSDDLTSVPESGRSTLRAVYYFAARSDRGEETPLLRTVRSFALRPAEGRPATPLAAQVSLKLGKGVWRLVVNVLDAGSGKMGTARATVRVE